MWNTSGGPLFILYILQDIEAVRLMMPNIYILVYGLNQL